MAMQAITPDIDLSATSDYHRLSEFGCLAASDSVVTPGLETAFVTLTSGFPHTSTLIPASAPYLFPPLPSTASNLMASRTPSPPWDDPPIVIVGAGVMGAATAYYLARDGLRATVVERVGVAAGASGKAGGFLAADWSDPPTAALAAASFRLHAELAADLASGGSAVDYRRLSAAAVALAPASGSAAARDVGSAGGGTGGRQRRQRASPAEAPGWLDGRAWTVTASRPLGTPATTAQVHPAKLTRALLNASGATLRTGTVTGVVTGDRGAVTGVRLAGGDVLPCGKLVLAMGPWSDRACAWLPAAGLPPVVGIKAHSVVLAERLPCGRRYEPSDGGTLTRSTAGIPPQALFLEVAPTDAPAMDPEVYPRPAGEVYVCGFAEPPAPVPEDPVVPTAGACERLAAFAAELTPRLGSGGQGGVALADGTTDQTGDTGRADAGNGSSDGGDGSGVPLPVHQACCLPISPDGLPLIGWLPGTADSVAIATGHGCWGILLGPATGLAVARLVGGRGGRGGWTWPLFHQLASGHERRVHAPLVH
ncbi:hypothetical protein MMPV_002334 [Pyropia vietnamensis]